MNKYHFIVLLTLIGLFSGYKAEANVLGRTVPIDDLKEDFESKDWLSDYEKNKSSDKFWHGTPDPTKGEPILKRITTPTDGKKGSIGALEISANQTDGKKQDEVLTASFGLKLGNLLKTDEPVFIVRVLLPAFDQSDSFRSFAFRQETHANNINYTPSHQSVPSIWVRKNQEGVNFYFRAANGTINDVPGPVATPGWWTLAIAFDDKGIGHYYIAEGTGDLTEQNEVFDTTRFPPIQIGLTNNPLMDDVAYSYFAIVNELSGVSPGIVIDDYEVWVKKNRWQ